MKLFLSSLHIISNSQPKEKDLVEKWNKAFSTCNETVTNSGMICIKHFKEEDISKRGTKTPVFFLRKGAVPSIFSQNDCVPRDDRLGATDEDEHGTSQMIDLVDNVLGTETTSLQLQLDEERKNNEEKINEKNDFIQNLSNDLIKFRQNSLAKFAMSACQNVEVILSSFAIDCLF